MLAINSAGAGAAAGAPPPHMRSPSYDYYTEFNTVLYFSCYFGFLISIFLRIINLIYIRTCDFGVHWRCFGLFVWFEFFGIGIVCECAIRQRCSGGFTTTPTIIL